MFEEFMKNRLRKKGFSVLRRRALWRRKKDKGSPVVRTVLGSILGGATGYYATPDVWVAFSKSLPQLQEYLSAMYSEALRSQSGSIPDFDETDVKRPNLHVEHGGYNQDIIDLVSQMVGLDGELLSLDGCQLDYMVEPDRLEHVFNGLKNAGFICWTSDMPSPKGRPPSVPLRGCECKDKPSRAYYGRKVPVGVPRPYVSPADAKQEDIGDGLVAVKLATGLVVMEDGTPNAVLLRPEAILALAKIWNGPPLVNDPEPPPPPTPKPKFDPLKWTPIGNHLEAKFIPGEDPRFLTVRFEKEESGSIGITAPELETLIGLSKLTDHPIKLLRGGWRKIGNIAIEAKMQNGFVLVREGSDNPRGTFGSHVGPVLEMTLESIVNARNMFDKRGAPEATKKATGTAGTKVPGASKPNKQVDNAKY